MVAFSDISAPVLERAGPADVRQMIAARDRSGRLLTTAQGFRYNGHVKATRDAIHVGVLAAEQSPDVIAILDVLCRSAASGSAARL